MLTRFISLIPLLSLGVTVTTANATSLGENADLDRQFLAAKEALDRYRGGPQIEQIYSDLIDLVERDEEYAPAYVELARVALKTSPGGVRGASHLFTPEAIAFARSALDTAIALEPTYADGWVLYGYVATHDRQPYLGLLALDRAEALRSESPWLHVNRGQALEILGQREAAGRVYSEIIGRLTEGTNEYLSVINGIERTTSGDAERLEFIRDIPESEAGAIASEETWQVLAERVARGERQDIVDALHYLQTVDQDNRAVILALEQTFLATPRETIAAAADAGYLNRLCTHAAHDSPAEQKASTDNRLELARRIRAEVSERDPAINGIDQCIAFLRKAAVEPAPVAVPYAIGGIELDTWLGIANGELERLPEGKPVPPVVTKILRAAQRSGIADERVEYLAARVFYLRALRQQAMGQDSGTDVFQLAAAKLDAMLTASPGHVAGGRLYREVLLRQGREHLASILD